jgi:hypothetical protein
MMMKMWRKRDTIDCWWECKLVQTLFKSLWRFLKNLNMKLPFDLATTFLGIYLKEMKSACKEKLAYPCLLQQYSQ